MSTNAKQVNFELLSCTLDQDANMESPRTLLIKVLSNLLQTHQIIDGVAQVSVDVVMETNSGNPFIINDSADFKLNSINFNSIDITYKKRINLRLDRKTLDITTMKDRTTQSGTIFKVSSLLYKCETKTVETQL